ncbi:MAG: divergent polysaccharide deacetylase family protein, partial [Campylobacteraceae bacterium]|nr:divergent polysaccharide deacetylase family protein [Campylobacteraceae bacterium]
GSAIAICHPRNITLKTLKESKHLLKDVQMVLINQL